MKIWQLRFSNRLQGHPTVHSVDICSDSLNRRRNSDLVVKKSYSFLRQNASSKFRDNEKLIPFAFEGANMSVKMRKRSDSISIKPTTASKFAES